jgi:hypothetical protein
MASIPSRNQVRSVRVMGLCDPCESSLSVARIGKTISTNKMRANALCPQVTTDFRSTRTIPPDFPQVLKDFVREILREQPENIYNFGARYFAELANPAPAGGGRAFENMSDEELLVWLTEIFVAADTDNNGIFQQP